MDKVDYTKYPEGFEKLAEDLTLPREGKEARESFLWDIIVALTKA